MINFDLDTPKKRKIINIILLIFLFVACTYLFYCMVNRVMTSDFPDHIDESLAGQS